MSREIGGCLEIRYRGFISRIYYLAEVDLFYGEVSNCEQLIVFQAQALQKTKEAMYQAIDEYLDNERIKKGKVIDEKKMSIELDLTCK